ncbi:hypothetical protein EZV62_021607 [Acer yangbiense]|uniref:non-specific serine/threonine protein kinase n=1 Tax=Acer yangbiense TaxID=1000413 RepID=A0A5C7H5V2_9ROSI|nr:hypothetical protein EZV62_021607 [Acer yangbiense]
MSDYSFLNDQLSKKTSIFGLRLWVVLGICVGAAIVLVLFLISLWFTSKRNSSSKRQRHKTIIAAKAKQSSLNNSNPTIPNISKEILEIRIDPDPKPHFNPNPDPLPEPEPISVEESPINGRSRIHIEMGKDHRISYPERVCGGVVSYHGSGESRSGDQAAAVVIGPEVSHLGWGHWYTLRELEVSTNGFADENVIGEGGYGIVYSGVLKDNTKVAVKNLLNNRMLVYEYVDNGNLEQWLHGDVGPYSPLTWEFRMNIILGTAKGNPVDYSRPPGEVNLVEWLKTMVTNRNAEGVVDARLQEKPSSRALKRALLVALRCVDPNAQKRPKMGHVIHMLEADEFPFRDLFYMGVLRERRAGREHGRSHLDAIRGRLMDNGVSESGDSSGYESGVQTKKSLWRKQEDAEQ